MKDLENETRIDARRALAGGLLAWVIQALVMYLYRLP